MRKQLLVAAGAMVLCGGAAAQSNEELKTQLDQALRVIQDLQSRVRALEQQQHAAPPPTAPAAAVPAGAPVTAGGAPVVAPNSAPEPGAPDSDKARLEIYGQAQLDAIYDAKTVNPTWAATLRPSQIPVNCPGDAGCGKNGSYTMSVRQTSLGLRAFIPTGIGLIKTDVAFDLYGADGGTHPRLLRAWGELGPFGAGQTDSNFMDLDAFPNTIDFWGPPGMVFVRNPQLRWTIPGQPGQVWAVSLEAPSSAIDTGKITQVDPSLGAGITGRNQLPDLVGSWRLDGDWGHVKAAAILRQVGFQNVNAPNANPSGTETGYGLNLAGVWKAFGRDPISWGLVSGRGIASYMNDGGVDLAPDANFHATTVRTLGWFAYYGHAWTEKWNSSIGYSQHRQDNTGGQAFDAFHSGSYASANLLYTLSKNVLIGGELLWGKRVNMDGASGSDSRVQFSTRVSF